MIVKTLNTRIRQLRMSTEQWKDNSTFVLGEGEVGIDTSLGLMKVGDGVSNWENLKVTPAMLSTDGNSIIDGGGTSFNSSSREFPTRIKIADTGSRPRETPIDNEPLVEYRVGNNYLHLKIGDGVNNVPNLKYIVPPDDVVIDNESVGDLEDFNV